MKLTELLEAFGWHKDTGEHGIEVKQSPIHGKGVFALRDFKKGDIVGFLESKVLSKKRGEELRNIKPHVYYVHTYKGKDLLAINDFKYMNSSDTDNNVIFNEDMPDKFDKVSLDGKRTSIIGFPITAVRDIKKGEEILTRYVNYEHFE